VILEIRLVAFLTEIASSKTIVVDSPFCGKNFAVFLSPPLMQKYFSLLVTRKATTPYSTIKA
jgi:hypothetical protein